MKTLLLILALFTLATAQVSVTIDLTANQASRLAAATVGFRPIPQVNTGTEDEPVWADSCTALQWTRFVIIDELKKKVKRWEKMQAKKSITTADW